MSDLYIVLPGIMGSVLHRDGEPLWRPGPGMAVQLLRQRAWMERLRRSEPEDLLAPWIDHVVPTAVMSNLNVIPGLWTVHGYDELHRRFVALPHVVEGDALDPGRRVDGRSTALHGHPSYYRFAYDWRRDLRASALRLHRLVAQALPPLRERDPAAKVVLVGHSMGGLLARYWMEGINPEDGAPFDGWRDTRALITLGTPHRGSLNALQFLVSGYRKAFVDFSETIGTFEGLHQLLPRYPALAVADDADGARWRRPHEAEAIGSLDSTLARAAFTEFHLAVEDGQARNRTREGYPARAVVPYVGFGHRTQNSASWDGSELELSRRLPPGVPQSADGGDGTVPFASAVPIELSTEPTAVRYVNEGHGALQANPHLLDDAMRVATTVTRGLLDLREDRVDPRTLGTPSDHPHLAVDASTAWVQGDQRDLDGDPAGQCVVTPCGLDARSITLRVTPVGDDAAPLELAARPDEPVRLPDRPGTYQLTIRAEDGDGGQLQTSTAYTVLAAEQVG